MKVKELKDNLDFYDDNAEIEFTLNQEIEVDSWKENKYGMKYVEIDKKLDILVYRTIIVFSAYVAIAS